MSKRTTVTCTTSSSLVRPVKHVLECLPPEAFAVIVGHEPFVDVLPLRLVCRSWNVGIAQAGNEDYWKQSCLRVFPELGIDDESLLNWNESWQDLWKRAWRIIVNHRAKMCMPRLFPAANSKKLADLTSVDNVVAIRECLRNLRLLSVNKLHKNAIVKKQTVFLHGKHMRRGMMYAWEVPSEGVHSSVVLSLPNHQLTRLGTGEDGFLMATNVNNRAHVAFWKQNVSIRRRNKRDRDRFGKDMPPGTTHIVDIQSTLKPILFDEAVLNHFAPNLAYMLGRTD